MSGPYKLTGRETSYMPQLTIVILQYRPDAAALRRTLASLTMQDTRDFAVVLGDDGSAQDYFAESRAYLAAHGITDVQTAKLIPNGGTGYRFNNEGNHVSYRCDVKRVTTINFDRNKIRKMCADLSKKSDETSAALDAALVNTPVEYEAPFDVNETFAEAFEAHMSALS